MAYYAALVSLVELLKEIIHPIPDYHYPKYLLHKQQITCLYEKFSHLQVLLEKYSPKDKEADGFLERIRDVACRVQHFIEGQTSDAACQGRLMPDAAYEAKCMIESQISDQVRETNCLAEIIRLFCFTIFASAYHNSEPMNKEVVETMRKGYRDLSKLTKELEYVVEIGYDDLEKSTKEVNSIMGEGYLDVVKLKEEIDSIAVKGYQDLVKLKEELDAIMSKGYQDQERVEQVVHSIVIQRYQDLERVKKEVEIIVGKGYDDHLEKLKKEVDPIVEELMMRIKDSHKTHQEDLQVTVGGPSNDGTTMVVLDENCITTIKDRILGDSSKLEVISIVGMGGIGKTTLARGIFDDKRICSHFQFRVWVTVSQIYDLPNILRAIVISLDKQKESSKEEDSLQKKKEEDLNGVGERLLKERIRKCLFGYRYLIILDDVWDTKILDDRNLIFPDVCKESRIMITTRESNVASVASQSDFINWIPTLTPHQSWTLFCKKVHCPRELEDIGRLIVEHCGGLPLAIVVIAGLLSEISKTRDDWGDIERRVSSAAAGKCSKILSLSYDNLPHHLKPCFLYLGGFPEDYEISVSRLVKLWVAEGFLKPVASKCLQEAAEEYLEELVKRSLVLVTKRRSNGKFKSCIVHDLLRELCLERARHEHFLLVPHKHTATHRIHRFFIHANSPYYIDMQKNSASQVRSVVSFHTKNHFISHSSNFKPLRVLDAPFTRFDFLHAETFYLINLRLLVLYSPESDIPSSISQLQHLQTLIVRNWLDEISLPAKIWEMPRLRHVLGSKLKLPRSSDGGSNKSGYLETLSTIVNFRFTSGIVEMIPNIKKLKLRYRRNKNPLTKFCLEHLVHLHQLETLAIKIDVRRHEVVPFPESFAFPSNLRKLTLEGCQLRWKYITVVGTLPHLQVLKLRWRSFVGEEWESKEGEFPSLNFLEMFHLFGLVYWKTEETHFPCLEHLVIRECHNLAGIPSEVGEFRNLKLIEVWSHDSSRVKASALEIQEEQLDVGNETLQVRVYGLQKRH